MKPKNRVSNHLKHAPRTNANELEDLAEVACVNVEHLTTLEFLRRCPHHPTADDLSRFGDLVRRMADAIPLPWMPITHATLGIVRVYPLPLLEWVYSQFVKQIGWPALVPTLENSSRKRALRELDEAVSDAPQPVKDAMRVVLNYLECVTGEKKPEPVVLKPV